MNFPGFYSCSSGLASTSLDSAPLLLIPYSGLAAGSFSGVLFTEGLPLLVDATGASGSFSFFSSLADFTYDNAIGAGYSSAGLRPRVLTGLGGSTSTFFVDLASSFFDLPGVAFNGTTSAT